MASMKKSKQDKLDSTIDQAERAVAAFVSKIAKLRSRDVHPAKAIEVTLLLLCNELTQLIDDPVVANSAGPATLKLSNAMADYRDLQSEDR